MAKVVAGRAHIGNLVADEFLYYADILALLRREEIILFATLYRERNTSEALERVEGKRTAFVREQIMASLVPHIFASAEGLQAAVEALSRTGLVVQSDLMWAPRIPYPSPVLVSLMQLAPFEAAMGAEGEPLRRNPNF